MDCTERQRILNMSDEEFDKLHSSVIEEANVHYLSCSACQALEAKTGKALEPYFEVLRAMDTEESIRKGFAENPTLAEQLIADVKEAGHIFAKDNEDGLQRLKEAAASSPRLKALLESGEAPSPEGALGDGSL